MPENYLELKVSVFFRFKINGNVKTIFGNGLFVIGNLNDFVILRMRNITTCKSKEKNFSVEVT